MELEVRHTVVDLENSGRYVSNHSPSLNANVGLTSLSSDDDSTSFELFTMPPARTVSSPSDIDWRQTFDATRASEHPLSQEDTLCHIFSYVQFKFTTLFEFSVVCKQWWLIIHSEHFLARVREQLASNSRICLLDKASTKWILSQAQMQTYLINATELRYQV
jgi:hypothetical protein